MRFIAYFVILNQLILLSGCDSKQPAMQSVHGKSEEFWKRELKRAEAKNRITAIKALQTVGGADPSAILAISSALSDKDAKVRDAAALALLNIGPAATGAVDDLTKSKGDKDATVRKHADEALKHIRE